MYAISKTLKHGPEQHCRITAIALLPLAVLVQLTAVGTRSFILLPFCSVEQALRFTLWNVLHALRNTAEFAWFWLKFSGSLSGSDSLPLSSEPSDSDSPDPAQSPEQQPPSLLPQTIMRVQPTSRSPSLPVFTVLEVLFCLNCLAKNLLQAGSFPRCLTASICLLLALHPDNQVRGAIIMISQYLFISCLILLHPSQNTTSYSTAYTYTAYTMHE